MMGSVVLLTTTALLLVLCQMVGSQTLIWSDEFDTLDESKWEHLVTAWDGGNAEFQYYRNDRRNTYVRDGVLYIRPTLVADEFGEDFLYHGSLNYSDCNKEPCESVAGGDIVRPVFSARLSSKFATKYGKIEIRAQLPRGNWLWPAIWMYPRDEHFGEWPRSGEIDIVESRGNMNYFDQSGKNQGIDRIGSTLHDGPDYLHNWYWNTHWEMSLAGTGKDYASEFYVFALEWTDTYVKYSVNGEVYADYPAPEQGFWYLGEYDKDPGGPNIWEGGNNMTPFDQEFYIILNVAIGGYFFPDEWNPHPWSWFSGHTLQDYWEGRDEWIPTWNGEEAAMKIDYVRIYSVN